MDYYNQNLIAKVKSGIEVDGTVVEVDNQVFNISLYYMIGTFEDYEDYDDVVFQLWIWGDVFAPIFPLSPIPAFHF